MVRHHRLLELFFISERFEDRIAALLGDPAIDPHGHFIPRKYEDGEFKDEVPLLRWPVGQRAAVSSVSDRDSAMLRELERLGLTPGARVIVDGKTPGASLAIRFIGKKKAIRLSNDLASSVFVAGSE